MTSELTDLDLAELADLDLAAVADESMAIGLRCAPADRAAAEAGVRAAYAAAGRAGPALILWCDSPAAGARAVGALRAGEPSGDAGVDDALRRQGATPGRTVLGANLRPLVRTRPWAGARAAAQAALGTVGYARHWTATARRPWQQLVEEIATPLRRRLEQQLATEPGDAAAQARAALLDAILGQHDAAWLGAFGPVTPALAALTDVAGAAGWWWAFENVAVITERPVEVHRENLGRLHRADGPALAYPDGFGLHAWRGMPIPAGLAALTVKTILAETNAEIRRVMLEHFGYDRYLRESGATKRHSDETGTLWRVELPGDEPLVMVEVLNASPEPDGTFRTYFLRVPPSTQTARAGVAWTFGLTEEEYRPSQQT